MICCSGKHKSIFEFRIVVCFSSVFKCTILKLKQSFGTGKCNEKPVYNITAVGGFSLIFIQWM